MHKNTTESKFLEVARKVKSYCGMIDITISTEKNDSSLLRNASTETFTLGSIPPKILAQHLSRATDEKTLFQIIVESGMSLRELGTHSHIVTLQAESVTLARLESLERLLGEEIIKLASPEYLASAKRTIPHLRA